MQMYSGGPRLSEGQWGKNAKMHLWLNSFKPWLRKKKVLLCEADLNYNTCI